MINPFYYLIGHSIPFKILLESLGKISLWLRSPIFLPFSKVFSTIIFSQGVLTPCRA